MSVAHLGIVRLKTQPETTVHASSDQHSKPNRELPLQFKWSVPCYIIMTKFALTELSYPWKAVQNK